MEIGDRVSITNYGYIENKNVKSRDTGRIVDIVEFRGMYSICVEMDRYIGGHSGNGLGKDGHCVWVSPKSLALEIKKNKEKKAYE